MSRLFIYCALVCLQITRMSDDERNDLLELQRNLRHYLPILEQQLLAYPPNADDELFRFLITKLAKYRDTLVEIENRLQGE